MSDETLDDVLSNALNEGDMLKTAQLVNLTFTITAIGEPHHNTFPAEYDKEGNETKAARTSTSYKASIIFDGEEVTQVAWLGGGWLTPQVKALVDKQMLPARVKIITDTTKNGNPYIMVVPNRPAPKEDVPFE